MEKWKTNSCPRCGGSTFIDKDIDGWFEGCINCSYRVELEATIAYNEKPDGKRKPSVR